ncbi:hypothetical protein SDC9_87052 [bioreactor metagenome]|uniref:Uncharacterized protein n=1 Tax=bioreactor metagenome TaxID=1076179 RepID=A0A644ZKL5_9ZZZZ
MNRLGVVKGVALLHVFRLYRLLGKNDGLFFLPFLLSLLALLSLLLFSLLPLLNRSRCQALQSHLLPKALSFRLVLMIAIQGISDEGDCNKEGGLSQESQQDLEGSGAYINRR